jgi:hypothetical protein
MKSSSISIQFVVNDLNANYEVIGTSDNYSFQYKLGKGSDLVDGLGGIATKIVSLKGNYGVFEVKIFAVSDIGIRSDFISESITISPPTFDQTFTFNNLRISDLRGAVVDSLFVEKSPAEPGDDLIVSQQFAGKDMEVLWELIPPVGHALEGQSVSTELLSDTLFSGFIVNIKSDDQVIDVSSYDDQNSAIQSFSSQFNTNPNNVAQDLSGFRNFSLTLDRNVFDGFDLSRSTSLEIVAVDSFGRTATGTISGNNPTLFLNNLTSSLNGSEMSFSWAVDSIDYSGMNINVLGIPENRELFDSGDLTLSKNFIEDINSTISNNLTWNNNFNYNSGDLVAKDGDVFRSNIDHTSSYNNAPQNDSATWTNYGQSIDYVFEQESLGTLSFNQEQFFGYKYYYTFQAFDDFGPGDLFLLSEGGSLSVQGEEDSLLFPFQSEIRIANLRYFEREDDLVFNWDIVDQDENAVDLVQYRAAFKEGGLPAILGLSGSLYDVHTNQIITGLTEGNNSISLTKNEDGDTELVYGLQTSKIFNTYEYTREINNSIYGTGGFPSIYESFDYTKNYNSGEHVIDDNQNVYKAILETSNEDPKIKPVYDQWQKDVDYVVGESFYYQGIVYKVDQNFGPQYTEGLFDFSRTYVAGDLVIAPDQYFEYFDVNNQYQLNDLVVYNSTLYKCLAFQEASSAVVPGTDSTKWRVASLFSEVDCNVYKAVSSSQGLIPINETVQEGGVLVDKWQVCYPDNSDKVQSYIQSYSGFVFEWNDIDNFTSGDLAVYANDIWSGIQDSGPDEDSGSIVPGTDSQYWVNQSNGQDIIFSYNSGDIVYNDGTVYKANADDPVGAPIFAVNQPGEDSQSSYQGTEWIPYWQQETQYQSTIFGNIGIPQSGKRSVGIELAIVDREGDIFDAKRLSAENPPPYILTEGFNVDSTSEATKVKFNFNYALGFQEKTTKVYLYRSESPDFDVVDEYGFSLTGENTPFVKSVVGAGDATFGQNITQIIDEPPIPQIDGVDQITGYYYKILPFDDFGSGVLYEATNNNGILEKVLVYPKRYNSPNPDVMPGRVLRADPTEAAGAVPGPVVGFSGSTAFENFFLNWKAPGSEYQQGSTTLLKQKPNDIDHYEVWASSGNVLYTGDNQGNANPWIQDQNTGYRQIEGVMYSVGNIPQEFPDPALKISGAENIFNVPANAPSVETVYPGKTNDTKNFWIRAVDFGGNKSPFTGASLDPTDDILGLSLTLGQASATDVTDFETSLTETFTNSIALNPNNPFSENGHWQSHKLFYSGVEYDISANSNDISDGYIWWQTGNTFYDTGSVHPANIENNANFNDGDFVVGRINDLGEVTPAFSVFANALIGTANVANAAIVDAKINDLKADKITAGEISSADIQISTAGSEAGVIRSAGFTGIDFNPNRSGFYISGDGTFAFQGGGSSLSFEDDTLTLRGKLRQTNGFDFDFIDLDVSPSYFNYVEAQGYENSTATDSTFIADDNSPSELEVVATFRNSSVQDTGVRFRMDVLSGNNRRTVFGYNDFSDGVTLADGQYNISGFEYNPNNFQDASVNAETKIATAKFNRGQRYDGIDQEYGFDYIIDEAFPGSGLADSVVLYASGLNSTYEKSVTITRVNDGRIGQDGLVSKSVSLRASENVIVYNSAGSSPDTASITLTAEAQNFTNAHYKFSGGGSEFNDETSFKTSNTATFTVPFTYSASPYTFTVQVSEGSSGPAIATDIITIASVKPGEDGENAYTVILTNENHTFSTDKNGNVSSYTGSGTKVVVYNGSTQLTAVASNPATGEFSISRSVTSGTITAGAVDSSNLDTILQHSNMTTDQAVVTITINAEGNSFDKDQTLSKSKQGINGNTGASPTYRGEWKSIETYVFKEGTIDEPGRGDIVKADDGNYYIAIQDSGPDPNHANPTSTQGASYWKDFGAVFDNVATNLLLTEEAFITDSLTVGKPSSGGVIKSNGFVGGLYDTTNPNKNSWAAPSTENYSNAGFLLARAENDSSAVYFDIGGRVKDSNGNDIQIGSNYVTSYLRFRSNSGKIEIKGSFTNNTSAEDVATSLNFNESLNTFDTPTSVGDTLATFIGGGYNNNISSPAPPSYQALSSSIVAGANNEIVGRFSFIGNGVSNTCKDNFSFIGGGYKNEMPVDDSTTNAGCNFIGAGQSNTINGGSNQTILGGDHNSITYTL